MVAKIKEKFIPKDYQINLLRILKNLRHKILSVNKYTGEFYRMNIRAGQKENDDEKTTRYINGLRYEIHLRKSTYCLLVNSRMRIKQP
jgi:hypothetical protein